MQKKLIVGNLKMNPVSPAEMERYLDMLEKELKRKKLDRTEIVICPPIIFFDRVVSRKLKNVKLGAQNAFWEYKGAYTGEISSAMVKAIGAEYSMVGHSERRKYFGENEVIINRKLKAILKSGLKAVLCIGESKEERRGGQTPTVIKKQIHGSLEGIGTGKLENIIITYEPIWAVATDNVPTSDEILEAKIIIRKTLSEIYSAKSIEKVRLLYGGSINSRSVYHVCIDPAMDGGLVGRESLLPYELVKIAKIIDAA